MNFSQSIQWKEGEIEGCVLTPLQKHSDDRGWLAEFFRMDELPTNLHPAMGYLSLTYAGVSRGPHEHEEQTDLFLFFDGTFRLYLWDSRRDSPTYGKRRRERVGYANPSAVIIPPGVVHAYMNIGESDAYSINCPNRLYAGDGKQGPVDEIRHEDVEHSAFVLD